MSLLPDALSQYAEAHTTPESPLLRRINQETYAHVAQPDMLSGHLQGRVLAMLSRLLRPRRVLEIGTYTGYSALCLAEGLTDDGRLFTIDVNAALAPTVRAYLDQSPLGSKVACLVGTAAPLIPTLDEVFDLVFIDADKGNYGLYFDLTVERVRPGGFLLADNVLWKGKVADPAATDRMTENMRAFNEKCRHDDRVEVVLLPIRDGLLLMRRRETPGSGRQ